MAVFLHILILITKINPLQRLKLLSSRPPCCKQKAKVKNGLQNAQPQPEQERLRNHFVKTDAQYIKAEQKGAFKRLEKILGDSDSPLTQRACDSESTKMTRAHHCQELLNPVNPVDHFIIDQLPQLTTISELDALPSLYETSAAANNLKNKKAPDADGMQKYSNMGAICCYSDSTPSLAMCGHRIFFPHNGKMCWVRVASSTWNVLWLWNTSKGRPQKQVQKTAWEFFDKLSK